MVRNLQNPVRNRDLAAQLVVAPNVVDGSVGANRAGDIVSDTEKGSKLLFTTHLETSLAPWVKEAAEAVKTWRNEYMYSARLS